MNVSIFISNLYVCMQAMEYAECIDVTDEEFFMARAAIKMLIMSSLIFLFAQ